MIKGLKKDHGLLSDLLVNQYHIIQKILINTFEILIESFQSNNPNEGCAKLLECIYIKQKISSIDTKRFFLKTITFGETAPMVLELQSETQPIFNKALTILESVISDYTETLYSNKVDLEFINAIHSDFAILIPMFTKVQDSFISFISNCQTSTKFSPSSYSTHDDLIMIVNFDEYDDTYLSLFHDLYSLQDFLKDLEEGIRKESPCFKDYIEALSCHKPIDEVDAFDVYSDSADYIAKFDLDDFERFSTKRKIKLGIESRRVFSDY